MDAKAREIAIKILKAIEYVDDFWEEDLGKVEALLPPDAREVKP